MDEVDVLDVNPCYVRVKYPSGREDNVSLKYVAPAPQVDMHDSNPNAPSATVPFVIPHIPESQRDHEVVNSDVTESSADHSLDNSCDSHEQFLGFRRSIRIRSQPQINYKE